MFVQRLTHWLRRFFTSRSARAQIAQAPHSNNSAVMSGCVAGQRSAGQHAAPASSGSWLADGRMLRPRPATQEPQRPVRGITPRQQPAEQQQSQPRRTMPSRPVPAHPAAEALPPDVVVARTPSSQPSQPIQPVRLTPASLDAQDDTSGVSDQVLYRRLMSLKRLVRLGIYGEGFDADSVPEQYLHSLGRDEDFTSDWDVPSDD